MYSILPGVWVCSVSICYVVKGFAQYLEFLLCLGTMLDAEEKTSHHMLSGSSAWAVVMGGAHDMYKSFLIT